MLFQNNLSTADAKSPSTNAVDEWQCFYRFASWLTDIEFISIVKYGRDADSKVDATVKEKIFSSALQALNSKHATDFGIVGRGYTRCFVQSGEERYCEVQFAIPTTLVMNGTNGGLKLKPNCQVKLGDIKSCKVYPNLVGDEDLLCKELNINAQDASQKFNAVVNHFGLDGIIFKNLNYKKNLAISSHTDEQSLSINRSPSPR